MNADEAKREATKALAARLRAWGVDDHLKHAENYLNDMTLAGWIWMPPTNRPRPPKPTEACRTCGRALHAPDVVCDRPTDRPLASVPPPVTYLEARRSRPVETDQTDAEEGA